jgi:hypothetical protein
MVVQAAAVEQYGTHMMDALNSMSLPKTHLPAFAEGGPVLASSSFSSGVEPLHRVDISLNNKPVATVRASRKEAQNLVELLQQIERGL